MSLSPPDPWLVNGHHYQCSFITRGGLCDCRGPAASERLPIDVLVQRLDTVAAEARYFQENGMWVNLDRTHADLLEQAAWYLKQFLPAAESAVKELPAPDDEIIDAEIVEDE